MITDPVKIAIFGPAGSGKDYVANAIIKNFKETLHIEMKRFAFADNLKKIVNTLIGLDDISMQDFAIYSEDFKNRFFIDLDSLDRMWIFQIPEKYSEKGDFGENSQILYKDPEKYGISDWFTIYTANSLFELFQRASSGSKHQIIPNMVLNWHFESIKYPDGYNQRKDSYRRLMSYREYIVWVGTYCFQHMLGIDCLVNSMMKSIEFSRYTSTDPSRGAVITDLRFPHEYKACKNQGFKIIKIEADKKEVDIDNIAESYYSLFIPDFIFYNYRDKDKFSSELKRLETYIRTN